MGRVIVNLWGRFSWLMMQRNNCDLRLEIKSRPLWSHIQCFNALKKQTHALYRISMFYRPIAQRAAHIHARLLSAMLGVKTCTKGWYTSLATMGSAPYRYLSSLTPGRDVLRNNADWLPMVTTLRARLLKTFERMYGACRTLNTRV